MWHRRLAVFILLSLLAVPAQAQTTEREQRAANALRQGRYGEALAVLDEILAADATDVSALVLRGNAHESRGDDGRAIADYERVLQLDPSNVLAREGLRRARANSNDAARQSLETLRLQVTTNPNGQGLLLRYANALYDAAEFRQAAQYYARYLERGQPVPDIIHRYLISIASYEGDNDVGERVAERYLALYAADSDLHMRLGYFRLWQNDRAGAAAAFTEALRLDPQHREARQGLEQASQAPARAAAAPAEFIVDRLQRQLRAEPDDDEKRFALVEALIRYERLFEAYDELVVLAGEHEGTERWFELLVRVDDALTPTAGPSPERLAFRLRHAPDALDVRYALVGALTKHGRIAEAYQILTEPPYANPVDPTYQQLMLDLMETGDAVVATRIDELERQVQQDPGDVEVTRALIDHYLAVQRTDEAIALADQLLARRPGDEALRLQYLQMMHRLGYFDEALAQARVLLERHPLDDRYKRALVLASVAAGEDDLLVDQYLDELVERYPDDRSFLLDLVDAFLARNDAAGADRALQRVKAADDGTYRERIAALDALVERARVFEASRTRIALLDEARSLAHERRYEEAIARYEAYFTFQGQRPRAVMLELAQVYEASGEPEAAIQTLLYLQAQHPEYGLAKRIATLRLYAGDLRAAQRDLERLAAEHPGDFEVRLLLGDTYVELGRYDVAHETYRSILDAAPTSRLARERLSRLDDRIRVAGSYGGITYGVQFVPTSRFVRGAGSGTVYERWGRGGELQLFVPLPVVLTAAYESHVMSGSRRLVPDAELIETRIDELRLGGYIDLTRPIAAPTSYTNRLTFEGGVHDYGGARRVPFGSVRFWHQNPGRYTAAIGLRNTEGALDLWSAAGDEFDLRLTQIDVRGSLFGLVPDSLLRVDATVLVNVVSDKIGTLASPSGSNHGVHVLLDVGYRVLDETVLGLRYDRLGYQSTVDLYYSPNRFQSYYLWLDYQRRAGDALNVHLRGMLGLSARTGGFVSRQVESTLTYWLTRNLSLNTSLSVGQSSRPFVSTPTRSLDRYSTFVVTGFLTWSL